MYTNYPNEPSNQNGKIFIQSKPTSASIYLNNKNTGIKTPDTLKWLASGNHLVTLKLPLYQDTVFMIETSEGQTKNVLIDFTLNNKNVGQIYVGSRPAGSDIWLNDSLTNKKTPFTLTRLAPGNYGIKCTNLLCRPDSTNVTVSSSKTTQAFLTLEDTSKWVSYNTENSPIISDHVFSLTCDKINSVWIGTDNGLMSLAGSKWNFFNKKNSVMQSDYVNCIAVDNMNRKWIGTSLGLFVYDGNTWIDYSSNLPFPAVTAITFDKLGNTWIGTQKGLVKYSNNNWQTFTTSNSGIKENFVTCLAVDAKNNIWVGSVNNGISVLDGSSWTNFNSSNINIINQTLDYVQSIAIDNKGIVWVSALTTASNTTQLLTYNSVSWKTSQYQDYLKWNLTYSIFVKDQFVILGNRNGIAILNNDTGIFSTFDTANSKLALYRVDCFTLDNYGDIWLGTFFSGLGKFKAGNF